MDMDVIKTIGMRNYLKLMDHIKDDVEMRIEKGQLVIKFLNQNLRSIN